MILAVAVLLGLLASICWTAARRTGTAAWTAVAFAAAWLPANNGQLEGHNLLVLSSTHAVTQADAVGIACWLGVSAFLVRRAFVTSSGRPPSVRSAMSLLTSALVFALGALVAVATG